MFIPIHFDPRMTVPGMTGTSASKPGRFAELMAHKNFRDYGNHFSKVVPVTKEDLALVHSEAYIRGVFDGTVLNGFENNDTAIAEACLWTVGSMLSAAREALEYPISPACSPSSGFHHAHRDYGGGYCTFNGLVVTAAKLISERPSMNIAILDCDMHYGDGTHSILDASDRLSGNILHFTAGKHFHGDNPASESLEFSHWLHECIDEVNAAGIDLVLYQAGADPHVNDPLGGFLTTRDMYQRDLEVFKHIRAPIAWNLAGGYQKNRGKHVYTDPVLQLHEQTMGAARHGALHRSGLDWVKRL